MPEDMPEDMPGDIPGDAEQAAARQEAIAAAAPDAEEPLLPESVNGLAEMIMAAVPRLTRGQVPAEAVQMAPVDAPVDVLPPDIFAAATTIATGIQAAADQGVQAAVPYVIDPIKLSTNNAGLQEMANAISAMGSDSDLIDALVGGGADKPTAIPEEPPAPPSPAEQAKGLVG